MGRKRSHFVHLFFCRIERHYPIDCMSPGGMCLKLLISSSCGGTLVRTVVLFSLSFCFADGKNLRVAPSGTFFAPAHPGRAKKRPVPHGRAHRSLLALCGD